MTTTPLCFNYDAFQDLNTEEQDIVISMQEAKNRTLRMKVLLHEYESMQKKLEVCKEEEKEEKQEEKQQCRLLPIPVETKEKLYSSSSPNRSCLLSSDSCSTTRELSPALQQKDNANQSSSRSSSPVPTLTSINNVTKSANFVDSRLNTIVLPPPPNNKRSRLPEVGNGNNYNNHNNNNYYNNNNRRNIDGSPNRKKFKYEPDRRITFDNPDVRGPFTPRYYNQNHFINRSAVDYTKTDAYIPPRK